MKISKVISLLQLLCSPISFQAVSVSISRMEEDDSLVLTVCRGIALLEIVTSKCSSKDILGREDM